jgi:hypothetical protein
MSSEKIVIDDTERLVSSETWFKDDIQTILVTVGFYCNDAHRCSITVDRGSEDTPKWLDLIYLNAKRSLTMYRD